MAKSPSNLVTAGDVQDLAVAVEQLTEETRILRQSLDELRDDVVWAARQVLSAGYDVSGTPPPRPIDPLAPDQRPIGGTHSAAATLEHAMDHADQNAESPYCCDRPKLAWNGDPDAPGVACESCGYVVAELGSVVIWRDEEASEPASAKSSLASQSATKRQGSLFGRLND